MKPFQDGKPVYALLNVHSGWADGTVCQKQLSDAMADAGVELQIQQGHKGLDITGEVRRAREQGVGAVIAGGGDGTLNGVAAGLSGSEVPMAILPIGTLNHLARDLGVSLDINEAIAQLRTDRIARIDLAEVNGRVFINNSVIGLFPQYWFTKERIESKWKMHWLSVAFAIVTVFRRYPFLHLTLIADGREIRRQTPYMLIANNEHKMEGYELGTRARLDSGKLFVYVMKKLSRWGLIRAAAALLFGRFKKTDQFDIFAASSLRVESRRRKLAISLDGEVTVLRTPLEFKSLPGALRVIAPPAVFEKAPEA